MSPPRGARPVTAGMSRIVQPPGNPLRVVTRFGGWITAPGRTVSAGERARSRMRPYGPHVVRRCGWSRFRSAPDR
jgi:hypothetical protein